MNNNEIKEIALENGFKLKPQENGDDDLNSYVYDFARSLIKSIVKKIDPDNLPEGEVLAFNESEIHCGYLESYKDGVICELEAVCLERVTHYIEQKDLIKLFK